MDPAIEPLPPEAITAEWISSQPEPYPGVESYFLDLWQKAGQSSDKEVLDNLPAGYRLVYLHSLLYSDVANGGFWQFLGNTYATDKSQNIIAETVGALIHLGVTELADLLKSAIAVMGARLPPVALSVLPNGAREKAAKHRPSDEVLRQQMEPIDDEFFAMNYSWIPKFDAYIKKHPEEFIHGGPPIMK